MRRHPSNSNMYFYIHKCKKYVGFVYAFQFYIANGECHAKHLSCGIGGMHDEYVFTCVLFYYGMLKI